MKEPVCNIDKETKEMQQIYFHSLIMYEAKMIMK